MITMCNGDLGMFRVMPWAYPTISGGSSGGTTVDPTPTPDPEPEKPTGPYDLSNYSISFVTNTTKISSGLTGVTLYFGLRREGAVEVDTSNVSSVKLTFGSGNMIISNGSTVSLTALKASRGGVFTLTELNSSSVACSAVYNGSNASSLKGLTVTGVSEGSTMIVNVYDSAGNVLQTKEVVIT